MKKYTLISFLAFLCTLVLHAQEFKTEKSEPFEEPSNGWNKVFQLKNGNTFFFHAARKEGLTITVYDPKRKQVAARPVESKLWDVDAIADGFINGLYEINGQPVLFTTQSGKLYRCIFNAADGTMVNEEELKLNGTEIHKGTTFVVEKDAESDCYAVAYTAFKSRSEHTVLITVCHYDGMHKLINQADYPEAESAQRNIRFSGVIVDGNKRLFLRMQGYSSDPADGGATCKIVLARLNAGEKTFTTKVLDTKSEFYRLRSVPVYDRLHNKIRIIAISEEGSKTPFMSEKTTTYYVTRLIWADPETMEVSALAALSAEKATEYGRKHIKDSYRFSGLPSGLLINTDNTTTITLEEYSTVGLWDQLGDIGVLKLNDDGSETNGWVVPKKQGTVGISPILRQNKIAGNSFAFPLKMPAISLATDYSSYMSFSYINTPGTQYVIFNDIPGNYNKEEDQKRPTASNITTMSATCYRLNADGIDKMYLFEEPGRKSNTYCNIEGADYNKATHTYATVITEHEGKDAKSRVAWVTFQ